MPTIKSWINLPAGSQLAISTSGPDGYAVHIGVMYVPPSSSVPPGNRTIAKDEIDPGPALIAVPTSGTVTATLVITFLSATTVDVALKGVPRGADGTDLATPFTVTASGKAGEHQKVVLFTGTGAVP